MFLEDMQQKTTNVWRIPIEVVKENEGIANFKASRHHMWIQARRDPKKKWLEMRYCTMREEVEWIVKDWPVQWKVPVTQKKGTKPKEQAEAGPSRKTGSPTDNTRKVAEHSQTSGSSATVKKTRKKDIVSREEVKGDGEKVKGDSSHKKEVQDDETEKKKTEV
jgi:hypothetical protein